MKISVAMTTCNGARYLREQLDSIFAQQRLPDELIVCDDRSTDATPQMLSEYAARSPFAMTVVINDQRLGSTKNFEQAIRLCTGDLIALSDQDDVWYPQKLQVIELRFEVDTNLGFVFSNGDLINENGEKLHGDMWRKAMFTPQRQKMMSCHQAYDLLLSLPFITGATMAFRSKFKSLILPISDGIPTFVHDRWIALLIAAVDRVGMIERKLVAYRLHPQQQLGLGKLQRYIGPHRCSSDQIGLARIRERLASGRLWVVHPEFLDALDRRQPHVAIRASLSRRLIGRVSDVAREYCSGQYRQYPLGTLTAVKDLLIGTQ
jgi:glycosyltransferase involved in cell wall biosynthesis